MTEESRLEKSIRKMLLATGMKKHMNLKNMYEKQKKAKQAMPPHRYHKKYTIEQKNVPLNLKSAKSEQKLQVPVWYLDSPAQKSESCILYLHGGAYITSFQIVHWSFFAKLIEKTHCSITAPDYPLTPEYTAADEFEFLIPLYNQLVEQYGVQNLFIMGDSAGGGMALALSQRLQELQLPQPAYTFLLSPWLDVNLTNPEIQEIDLLDPVLRVEGLQEVGKAYAGGLGTHHYLASPLFGDLEGLAPIMVFTGTYDILYPDCKELCKKAERKQTSCKLYAYERKIHVFMLTPIPESAGVMQIIADTIESCVLKTTKSQL